MGRSPAAGILADLRQRGALVVSEGTKVRVKSKGGLTPELREALTTHKADLLAALSVEDRILQMPLDQFECEDYSIEVRVPGLGQTLWFVPTAFNREALVNKGVARGRIWTAHELMDLSKIPSLSQEQAQTLARIKVEFDADIVSIEILNSRPDTGDGVGA